MFRVRAASSLLPTVALALAAAASSCVNPLTALPKLFEARRLSTELHVSFTRAADASNRSVMADTDEASIAAKDEAVKARQVVDRDVDDRHACQGAAEGDRLRAWAGAEEKGHHRDRSDPRVPPI